MAFKHMITRHLQVGVSMAGCSAYLQRVLIALERLLEVLIQSNTSKSWWVLNLFLERPSLQPSDCRPLVCVYGRGRGGCRTGHNRFVSTSFANWLITSSNPKQGDSLHKYSFFVLQGQTFEFDASFSFMLFTIYLKWIASPYNITVVPYKYS